MSLPQFKTQRRQRGPSVHSRPVRSMPLHAIPALPSYHPARPATSALPGALRCDSAQRQAGQTGLGGHTGRWDYVLCLIPVCRARRARHCGVRSTGTARDGDSLEY
ncbi:hypothetical protein V496_05194 [Pseudogymnoascus sp. VKM F-4515 (FW-2607)]|nr:hypothetical protein V496_05194 [Pseudogymnoascus sp. VKM F-4515 (FW-2607)]